MDVDLYFIKEVLEQYGVDKMLTPVNLGNGELENVSLSDLRKELDICYINIDNSITFKEKLLDYLEDYLVDIRAVNIPAQKRVLKRIQRKIKTLEKRHPNLDYNNKNDEVIIDEISNLTWKLEQEKYIFHYLKELPFFIRFWITEKRKEYNDEYLKNWINDEDSKRELKKILKKKKQNKIIKKPLPFYCQVGALFAQGFISKDKFDYYYKDDNNNEIFKSISKLSRYIQENILKTKKVIRPYINDTLSEGLEPKIKDFYISVEMMKKTIEYCKINNIIITPEFQSIYDDLIK